MSAVREIRIGKVAGLSSYDLAVKNGTFTGTLTEYLNKEQQYYNDMVSYCTEFKEEINTIVQPKTAFVPDTVQTTSVVTGEDTTVYSKRFTKPAFLTMSAFVQFSVGVSVTNPVMSVYINDTPICMSGAASSNVVGLSTNYAIDANDELIIKIKHDDSVNRLISISSINLTTTERS